MWSRIRKIMRVISFTTLLLLAVVFGYSYLQPDGAGNADRQRLLPDYAGLVAAAKTLPPDALQKKISAQLEGASDDARTAALRFLDDDTFRHADDAALQPAEFEMLADYYIKAAGHATDDEARLNAYRNALRARLTVELLAVADALRCPIKPPDDVSALAPGSGNIYAAGPAGDVLIPAYKAIDGLTFDRIVNDAVAFELTHGTRKAPDCGTAPPLDQAEWDLRRMNARDRMLQEWKNRRHAARNDGKPRADKNPDAGRP